MRWCLPLQLIGNSAGMIDEDVTVTEERRQRSSNLIAMQFRRMIIVCNILEVNVNISF